MGNTYLSSKPRYEILDGLRGVAAVIVVVFHLFETYSAGPAFQKLNHGYLAVDFFFVLSGFVISYAYDDRWDRMNVGTFFKRRITRLHPMVVMGVLFGVVMFYFTGDHPDFGLVNQTSVGKLMLVTLLGLFVLPTPVSMDVRGWGETYPINGTHWSLFLEYIANICYAVVLRRVGKAFLAVLMLLASVMTVDLGLNLNLFGTLGDSWSPNTFIGGWGIKGTQLYIGIARLCYPFLCGMLIARIGRFIKLRGGFWWAAAILALVLCMPRIGGTDPSNFWMNGVYETLIVLFVFPLLVMMGAGSSINGERGAKICKFLGDISYPIYITHYPLIYLQMCWMSQHPDAPISVHVFVAVMILVLSVGFAYASFKLYDVPVRSWLTEHWLKKDRK